jgi:hypothetical protein
LRYIKQRAIFSGRHSGLRMITEPMASRIARSLLAGMFRGLDQPPCAD